MIGSSSMMRTSVAICWAISRPASSIRPSTSSLVRSIAWPICSGVKPSTELSRNATRAGGVSAARLRRTPAVPLATGAASVTWFRGWIPRPSGRPCTARRGAPRSRRTRTGSATSASSVATCVGVTALLRPGQGAGKAPQIGEMRRDRLSDGHAVPSFRSRIPEDGSRVHRLNVSAGLAKSSSQVQEPAGETAR